MMENYKILVRGFKNKLKLEKNYGQSLKTGKWELFFSRTEQTYAVLLGQFHKVKKTQQNVSYVF